MAAISLAFFYTTASAGECEPGERGTFNVADQTFTRDANGSDYRVRCAGDQTDGLNRRDILSAEEQPNSDEPPQTDFRYYVVDIDADNDLTRFSLNIHDDEGPWGSIEGTPDTIVLTGDVEYPLNDGSAVGIWSYDNDEATPIHALRAESWADIKTTGNGGRGVAIYDNAEDSSVGSRVFVNRGSILTTGDEYIRPADRDFRNRRADGLVLGVENNDADIEAINETGATITTRGRGARGIQVGVDAGSGNVTAVNRGTIRTEGDIFHNPDPNNRGTYRANGISAYTDGDGEVEVRNEAGGIVTTTGSGSIGLSAASEGTSAGTATVVNHGTVINEGDIHEIEPNTFRWALGMSAYAENGGDATATNESSGIVTVSGVRGLGLDADAYGGGDATAINKGAIRATGAGGTGIVVITDGGKASARVENGIVVAGSAGTNYGFGIYADNRGGATGGDTNDDVDVDITISDSTITAHSAATDDPSTPNVSEDSGVGIWGDTSGDGSMGHINTVIKKSTITADRAIRFNDGRATVKVEESTINGDIIFDPITTISTTTPGHRDTGGGTVNDRLEVLHSTVTGDVEFGAGNDYMQVRGGILKGDLNFGSGDDMLSVIYEGGLFTGDLDFGSGNDRLLLDVINPVVIQGDIRNLEHMTKRCPGDAIVNDVFFDNSTMVIEEGALVLRGHADLGSEGTVTIHEKGLLAFEFGDIVTDPNDRGRLTAGGGVSFMEGAEEQVDVQIRHDVTNKDAVNAEIKQGVQLFETGTTAASDLQVTSGGTTVGTATQDGTATFTGDIAQNTEPVVSTDPPATGGDPVDPVPVTPPVTGGGGDDNSNSNTFIGIALLGALLAWGMDGDSSAFADYDTMGLGYRQEATMSAGLLPGQGDEYRARIGNSEHWTRSWTDNSPSLAGMNATSKGYAFGVDTYSDNGFKYGWGVMPSVNASTYSDSSDAYSSSSLEGELLSVNGGWRGNRYFANLNVLHGNYEVGSVVGNPVVNSALGGTYDMNTDHIQMNAGAKYGFAGARISPSVSLFAGRQDQDGYTASGPAMRAEIPSISQRYTGWKMGVNMTSSDWIQGSGRTSWRPALHLMTMGTDTRGPSSVSLQQSDRLGALDFASQANVRELPGRVNMLGASALVKYSDSAKFRIGYVGMEIDGEYQHAVMTRFRYQF